MFYFSVSPGRRLSAVPARFQSSLLEAVAASEEQLSRHLTVSKTYGWPCTLKVIYKPSQFALILVKFLSWNHLSKKACKRLKFKLVESVKIAETASVAQERALSVILVCFFVFQVSNRLNGGKLTKFDITICLANFEISAHLKTLVLCPKCF